MTRALEHYLAYAAQVHVPRFETWFPATFDWRRLCADVPAMARGLGHDAEVGEHDLEASARVVFRAGHLFALAVLAAVAEGTDDPGELVARLATAPGDEEEKQFDDLVGRCLGPVEVRLAGESAGEDDAPPEVGKAEAIVGLVWPTVAHVLAADESRVFERAGEAADVLWGVARVGIVLAAFRWMTVAAYDLDWPDLPLGRDG